MTFELQGPTRVPEGTTIASYTLSRLGPFPSLRCDLAETRRIWDVCTVTEVGEAVEGVRELVITTPISIGQTLFDGEWEPVGEVTEVAGNVATVEECLIEAPGEFYTKQLNTIGAQVYDRAPYAHSWSLVIEDLSGLLAVNFRILRSIVEEVLDQAEVTKTSEELDQLTMAMLQQDKGVDTFITSQLEQVELARRAGLMPSVRVIGNPA